MVVVGGGAAGFFGAIRAKTRHPNREVLILEAAARPLGKVKISGGGRCNVTYACFDVSQLVQNYPRGRRELVGVFTRFGPKETIAWFESNGVRLKTEADGRIFPITDDAQTIIDCLLRKATEIGIAIYTKCPVQQVHKRENAYLITTPDRAWEAESVLLATGSARRGWQWAAQLGHSLIAPVPSLFTFNVRDPLLDGLAGISFARVSGCLAVAGAKRITQEGALLITHWGLSGPVVLRLSAWGARPLHQAQYQAQLVLDFFPDLTTDALRAQLVAQKNQTPKKHLGTEGPLDLPKRFWQRLLSSQGISPEWPWAEVSRKDINRLVEKLKQCPFQIHGKGVFKEEFVTAGGVSLKEIDFRTMESRCASGLYLAGEIIDVDGLTGGFNFQNAWSTGWMAGESM